MLEEVYGKEVMKKMQVYECHKYFCDECASVNDDLR
jgi:acetone carboxylase gamma subunit